MICKNCQQDNLPNRTACEKCGKKLIDDAPEKLTVKTWNPDGHTKGCLLQFPFVFLIVYLIEKALG